MNRKNRTFAFAYALLDFAIVLLVASSALAQVGPAEIANPKLKVAEQEYLPQLQSLQHAIGETQFPLPFILTRYVGVDPARQASLDTRGLEFVYFQNRVVLKTSRQLLSTIRWPRLSNRSPNAAPSWVLIGSRVRSRPTTNA